MTKRTSKRQHARELALEALAEKIARQDKIKEATQEAFLAQAEFHSVRERFATALQHLGSMGESQVWMKESFGLTSSELRSLLALNVEEGEEDADDEDNEEVSETEDSSIDQGSVTVDVGDKATAPSYKLS